MALRIFDCHQWLFESFRVHQIRFRPGLRSDATGELTVLPNPLAGLMALLLRGRGVRERGKGEGKGTGMERKEIGGTAPTPHRKFLDPPLILVIYPQVGDQWPIPRNV